MDIKDLDKNALGDLYFKRSNGERVLIAENIKYEEAHTHIQKFLERHSYKSYYTRVWLQDNTVWYDVGSHSEFFLLVLKDGEIKN